MNGNKPTEATIGAPSRDLPKWMMERLKKQYAEMLAQEARIAAREEAAFRAYEASKGKSHGN